VDVKLPRANSKKFSKNYRNKCGASETDSIKVIGNLGMHAMQVRMLIFIFEQLQLTSHSGKVPVFLTWWEG
jgi:hypothetical protein